MEKKVTEQSIGEYAAAVRRRYRRASRDEKTRILDELSATSGYSRKAAIRLLNRSQSCGRRGRGRPRVYGPEVMRALAEVWEASGRLCGKRLAPFMGELLEVPVGHGEIVIAPAIQQQLVQMSAASVDRLLAAERQRQGQQPWTQRFAVRGVQQQVAVRTFGDWQQAGIGEVQADVVSHCGETTAGTYVVSLVVLDVASYWTGLQAVWGMRKQAVAGAFHQVRRRHAVGITALHTDNGGEFLNHTLVPHCQREGIRVTRGRPYKKNDQAWVEQRGRCGGSSLGGL